MSCANAPAWATLVDYWAGDLDPAASSALEEHLFSCGPCSEAAARVAAVTEAVRAALPPVVLRAHVDRLRARGANVRENAFAPGVRCEVEFSPDTDLLVHRLTGLDLHDAAQVRLRVTSEATGLLINALEDVPFDPAEGEVLIACQRHYAVYPADTVFSVSIQPAGNAPARTATYTILHRFL
jgi:anti-sigma factor RsiW